MSKKKKSTVGVLLSFLRGLIILVLILVLVGSVTLNIAFYNKDKPVEVNINLPFYKNHTTYFINNSGDLQEIEKGSLVIINPELTPATGRYVLCTIGKDYKTILAITEANANDNGTVSYVLKGTKESSTINYTVPAYKIQGVVTQQNEDIGYIIEFARSMGGIASLIAIPSFLLILICVISIRKNKTQYEDDLLESEILIEELRKIKKIEDKKKKSHEAQKPENEEIPEENTQTESIAATEPEPEVISEEKTSEASMFEDEVNRKAIEIKNAMHNQIIAEGQKKESVVYDKNPSANEIMDQMSAEMKTPSKPQPKQETFEDYASLRTKAASKEHENTDTNEDKVYQQQMAQLQAKQQQMAKLRQAQPVKKTVEQAVQTQSQSYAYKQPETQTPVHQAYDYRQPEQSQIPAYQEPVSQRYSQPVDYFQSSRPAPVKKKKKTKSVSKINADSFDDLIKMLDNEKKKLD